MFLSDKDIEQAVKRGAIRLEPFEKKQLQPASYDIRLSGTFAVSDQHALPALDPAKGVYAIPKTVEVKDGEAFVLHPGMTVLGYSKEYFGSGEYLIELNSKSSLARIGLLVHNSAGLVNPGHYLNITLALTNLNTVPILLRPGMEIAQLTFSPLSSESKKVYKATRHELGSLGGYVPPKSGPLARVMKRKR